MLTAPTAHCTLAHTLQAHTSSPYSSYVIYAHTKAFDTTIGAAVGLIDQVRDALKERKTEKPE
jgi:hypothetical protein